MLDIINVRVSTRSNAFPGSAIRGINEEVVKLERVGVKVYGFHIGQPGLPPSKDLLLEFTKNMLEKPFEYSMYTPSSGIEELREVRVEDVPPLVTVELKPGDEVIIETPGGGGYGPEAQRPTG